MSGPALKRVDCYRYVRGQRRWYCHACGRAKFGSSIACKKCHSGLTTMRESWALYEVRDGKARRVGTARRESEWLAFLGVEVAT